MGEITNSYSGGTPSVGIDEYYDGKIPFIRSGEINSESTEFFLTETGLNNSSAKMVNVGDILYALYGATSGEVGVSRICGAINQAILAIIPDNGYDTYFIMQWLRREKQNIVSTYLQGGQGNLSGTIVKDLTIDFPNTYIEQEKIGGFFRNLDNLITLHQRKLDKMKDLKKAFLNLIFSQKLRFYGFTDSWELRNLDDEVRFYNGLTYTPSDIVENDGTLVLRSSNVQNGEIVTDDNVYVRSEVVSSENVQVGDITVVVRNGSKALIGKHAKIRENMYSTVIGAFMTGIRSEHSSFINALLSTQSFDSEIKKNMGATINQITGGMFKRMKFFFPENAEQEIIGQCFDSIDNLITLRQNKIDSLKEVKKILLRNMLI